MADVISRAHSWVQDMFSKDLVVCTRCKVKVVIGEWTTLVCFPHTESESSGFKNDSDG